LLSRHLLNHRATQLNERETSLAAREQAVVEREERCASQERKISSLRRGLEAEREQLKAEKLRWDEERRASPPAGNGSAGSSSSERMEMEGIQEITPARMMGSRVPRRSFARPLEEKKFVRHSSLLFPSPSILLSSLSFLNSCSLFLRRA
jgi:hypothetical protein